MAPQASLGNILVVDDDLTVTDLLRLNLRSEGYNVLVKTSTADVSAADLRNVHLMLVDGAGQTPSGIDLISELKATPRGSRRDSYIIRRLIRSGRSSRRSTPGPTIQSANRSR